MTTDAPPLVPDTDEVPAGPGRRRRRWAGPTAAVAGLVALVGALLLPFAPVSVNTPEIRWPVDPAAPISTMLMLTGYEPAEIEVRVSCRVARLAAATSDGLALSTMAPSSRDVDSEALTVRARGGGLEVRSGGEVLYSGALPPGDCALRIRGDPHATTVLLDGVTVSTIVTRPGEVDPEALPESAPDPAPVSALPEVDALTTSVGSIPGAGPDDLSVRIAVDDSFSTSPTPAKRALLAVVALALAVGAVAAWSFARRERACRGTASRPRRIRRLLGRLRRFRPRVVDLVVPVVVVAWVFLAPMTDDDGYYSAMAANVPFSGYVPNYYQLYNQGYVPFSWPYRVLAWWQTAVGMSPVLQRVPAGLLGLATWALARSFVARSGVLEQGWRLGPALDHRIGAAALRWVLAVAFLSWWLPYDTGVRPESVVAFCAVAVLVAVVEGLDRGRLDLVGLGVGLASLGLMAAPTGFVALAPLLAAGPAVARLVRERSGSWRAVVGRWFLVLAPAAAGVLVEFVDGSYRDFVRAREIFAPIQRPQTWYAELGRYADLVDFENAFGSYARRTAVLVCLLALVWFLVLAVAARMRRLDLPPRLLLAGWSAALGFVLLLPSPSKPTHHFGALAGLGAAFLAVVLVTAPRLVRALLHDGPVPVPALVAATASAVGVLALAGHGRNLWPYAWGLGMPTYGAYPSVRGIRLDQPLWWLLALVLVVVIVAGWARRRSPGWSRFAVALAVPIVLVLGLTTTAARMVTDVARAADPSGGWSPQSDGVTDPFATRCGAAQQIDVLDEGASRAAPLVSGPGTAPVPAGPPPTGPDRTRSRTAAPGPAFVPGGWLPGSPPPAALPAGTEAWGSFAVPAPGADADARTGTVTTGWYRVPPAAEGALAVSVAGRPGGGNVLRAEYGRAVPGGVAAIASRPVGGDAESSGWRPVPLVGDQAPPEGADAVRLVATDATTDVGGWLAFTAPVERPWVPLPRFLPADGPVGVSWVLKFQFPCVRQPRQQGGVTEPAVAAIGYGETPGKALADDWTFDPARGGLLGHARRETTPVPLITRFRDHPEIDDVQVFDLRAPFPAGGYVVTPGRRTVSGLG